jgi:hypothetical protein
MREMRVTGRGRLNVKPDRIRLVLNLSDTKKDYEKVLKASAEMGAKLTELFEGCGFKADDLKTTNFFVDAQYEGYNDKDGNWKQKFVGYRFEQSLKIEFPIDNDRLGKILYALSKSGVKTEFRIQYTVADQEKCRKELLDGAIRDAKEKAAVLAKAGGVKLGEITLIDYSFGKIDIYSEPVNLRSMKCYGAAAACEDSSFSMNIVADDIQLDDTVTICYEMV